MFIRLYEFSVLILSYVSATGFYLSVSSLLVVLPSHCALNLHSFQFTYIFFPFPALQLLLQFSFLFSGSSFLKCVFPFFCSFRSFFVRLLIFFLPTFSSSLLLFFLNPGLLFPSHFFLYFLMFPPPLFSMFLF